MDVQKTHICVCVCTYNRLQSLDLLLGKLQNQNTNRLFTYSIVVVDNDHTQSAKSIVISYKKKSIIEIDYCNEPIQNISLARNKAVKNAKGDFVAFIDDDEFPDENWLINMYKTCNKYKAAGVLGPVKPYFENKPPEWIIKSKLCEKPQHKLETGFTLLHPRDTRTSNVLFVNDIFNKEENIFNPDFGRTGGEDVDFFRRMIERGKIFVWCNEAPVYEIVPSNRLTRSYFLKRALLRGAVDSKNMTPKSFIKSIIAILIYTIALPFLFLIAHHFFMIYLIKNCDHLGNLLGFCGIKIIKELEYP